MASNKTCWPLPIAKDCLSEIIKAAATQAQTITVLGEPVAVVLSPKAYARLTAPKRHSRRSLSADLLRPGLMGDDGVARDR